jgi:DNA-binding GntR family transcriptional regulator
MADTFALEAGSLRRIERAIAAGDLPLARDLLRAHRRRFADGVMAREASLLQVVVVCEDGNADAAARAVREHAVAFPDDPTVARLRKQACSKGANPE